MQYFNVIPTVTSSSFVMCDICMVFQPAGFCIVYVFGVRVRLKLVHTGWLMLRSETLGTH